MSVTVTNGAVLVSVVPTNAVKAVAVNQQAFPMRVINVGRPGPAGADGAEGPEGDVSKLRPFAVAMAVALG